MPSLSDGQQPADAQPQPVAESIAENRQVLVLLRQAPRRQQLGGGPATAYGSSASRATRDRLARALARRHGLEFDRNWPMPLLGLDCFIMTVPVGQDVDAVIARLETEPVIEWAQRMQEFATLSGHRRYNDPLFPAAPAARQWDLSSLHGLATGRGTMIAVIDTQIETRHPDLIGQMAMMRDFTDRPASHAELHGTGVAGVIAARANNGVGSVGIAPQARLLGLRACWQLAGVAGSRCSSLSLARALHFAIERNADVINLSLSGPPDPLLRRLIGLAVSRGSHVVASVDNQVHDGGFPASQAGVIAVSDVTDSPVRSALVAPGRGIPTTQTGHRWYLVNGSSFSAAHVSGLLALVHEFHQGTPNVRPHFVLVAGGGGAIDARQTVLGRNRR